MSLLQVKGLIRIGSDLLRPFLLPRKLRLNFRLPSWTERYPSCSCGYLLAQGSKVASVKCPLKDIPSNPSQTWIDLNDGKGKVFVMWNLRSFSFFFASRKHKLPPLYLTASVEIKGLDYDTVRCEFDCGGEVSSTLVSLNTCILNESENGSESEEEINEDKPQGRRYKGSIVLPVDLSEKKDIFVTFLDQFDRGRLLSLLPIDPM